MILSSPEYPKGHALIERHIQTIKKCMDKCDSSGYDFDLALLTLRATPLTSKLPSPAELFQSRRFRTTLPTYVADPSNSKFVKDKLKKRQDDAAAYYDKTAKEKVPLVSGQPVRLYNKFTRRWEPAVVIEEAGTPRSYIVQRVAGGAPLRRNRVQLRTTRQNFHVETPVADNNEGEDSTREEMLDHSHGSTPENRLSEEEAITQDKQELSREEPESLRRSSRV